MLQTFWSWRCQATVLLIGQILVGWLLVGLMPVRAVGGVTISGLQVSGGSGHSNEEYVELYNSSVEPVDIGGWRLAKLTKTGVPGSWTYLGPAFEAHTMLPGHTFALAVHVDATSLFGGDWQYSSSSLAEDNSVALINAAGVVVDLVGWGQVANFTGQPLPTAGVGRWARVLLSDKSLGDFAKSTEATRQGAADNFLLVPASATPTSTSDEASVSTSTASELETTSTLAVEEEQEPVFDLVLSEVYPQPNTGEVEFVELYNPNQIAIDLSGWYLVEGSGSQTMVTGTVAAQSFLKIAPIKGSLNNAGDEIQLWHDDIQIDGVAYGDWAASVASPGKGQSAAREHLEISGEWYLSNPTPGAANVLIADSLILEDEIVDEETTVQNNTGKLKINEIFPDPVGADMGEFIEIINSTAAEIAMTQWRLEVGGQEYILSDQVVAAGAIIVFYRDKSKLVLPNFKKEKVRLVRNDGSVSDSVSYTVPTVPGAAWVNVVGRGWGWSQSSTPGLPNLWKQLNRAPYAEVTGPSEALPGEVVNFGSDNVYDPDQDLLTYYWDLGDGQESTSTGISTVYNKPGKYLITLKVTDPHGLNDEAKWPLKVVAPVVESKKTTSTIAITNQNIVASTTSKSTKKTTTAAKSALTKPKTTGSVTKVNAAPTKGPALPVAARLLPDNNGKRVSVKGEVTGGSGKYWRLDDGTAEVVVILPAAKLPAELGWKKGTTWQVSGIVKKYKEDWAVASVDWEDLQIFGKELINTKSVSAMPISAEAVKKLWWLLPVVVLVVVLITIVKRRKTHDLVSVHVV